MPRQRYRRAKYDPYTDEYQCKYCGRWQNKPICDNCMNMIEAEVDEYLLERG